MLLYELLCGYEQLILYDEVRDECGTLLYMSATTYTNVLIDDDFNELIALTNDANSVLQIHTSASFTITPLKFNRDKIEICCGSKKIKLFANYFSEVLINEGGV